MAQLPNITSLTIPESITAITSDTFVDCPRLATITVAPSNSTYASVDGVLYNKDLTRILLFPGGTEGVVTLPDQIDAVPASALSYSANLFALLVGKNNATFSTINGVLYSKDESTLIACPGGIGETLTLPKQTNTIGPDALAGITTLKSIVVLGNITTIDPTAFNDQAKQSTTIALPGGEDYETRKQVWQNAGFKNFATPANPGDTQTPGQPGEGGQPSNPTDPSKPASGFTYKLLEDYTLEASWTGELSPASNPSIPTTAQLAGVSYTVSALAPSAFENQTALTGITLPNSLTTIGSRAFAGTGLATLDIPTTITTIGDQAFANCPNLTRIITHTNAIQIAPTALEACTNLEVWCPYNQAETYPWTIGLFATNNHIKAYGLPTSPQALTLEVGQSANLFEPGTLQAPDPAKTIYAYEATCLSVSQEGTITAKAPGTTTINTSIELDQTPLTHTTRTISVTAPTPPTTPEQPETPTPTPPTAQPITPRYPPNLATPTQASAPLYSRGGTQPRLAPQSIDVTLPLEPTNISINAVGEQTTTPINITSTTAEPIRATSITTTENIDPATGAAKLIADDTQRANTSVTVAKDPKDPATKAFMKLSGPEATWNTDPNLFRVNPGSPLSVTFGLDFPTSTALSYSTTDVSLASVEFTFGLLDPVATSLTLSSTAPKVGDTLTATPTAQVSGTKSTYTWYALDNAGETPTPAKVIPSTSSNSCKLTDLQKGKIICCALSDGPIDVSKDWSYRPIYSAETAPVAPGPPPQPPLPYNTLQGYSWKELSDIADYLSWHVGEIKDPVYVKFKGFMDSDSQKSIAGTNMPKVRIIGINHDVKSDGTGTAGLTFMATHSLPNAYQFNPTDTNAGGWEGSQLRKRMRPLDATDNNVAGISGTIWDTLPKDLRDVIKPVTKQTNNVDGNGTSKAVTPTVDKLWLPSYNELINNGSSNWGSYTWLAQEGNQYEFFRGKVAGSGSNPVLSGLVTTQDGGNMAGQTYSDWWERSCFPGNPDNPSTTSFLGCNGAGNHSKGWYNAIQFFGVPPGFCL